MTEENIEENIEVKPRYQTSIIFLTKFHCCIKIYLMTTIVIPKKEYKNLLEKSFRYDYLRQAIELDIFDSPKIRDIKEIVKEFKNTKLYNQKFLDSLKQGLNRSSYFE